MLVLDSHCDTPTAMMRGRDISIHNGEGHVDLPKLEAGGVDAAFFALYVPASMAPEAATSYALEMLAKVYDAIDANPGKLALALSPQDALDNKAAGLISIFIGIENGSPIQRSLSLLRMFHRMGARYLTLTHNDDNEIADCAAEGQRWHGLSPFGREVVAEMNRLGMIVDIAHASDRTFYDVLACSAMPVVSTHSCCRALAPHRRNLSDDMLRALADKGGVVQVNFYPGFLSVDPAHTSVEDVVRHIDHAVKVAGIDHVGIGSDFDGIEETPEGLEDISKMPRVFDMLALRGYSEGEVEKIAGGNFLRVFKEVAAHPPVR